MVNLGTKRSISSNMENGGFVKISALVKDSYSLNPQQKYTFKSESGAIKSNILSRVTVNQLHTLTLHIEFQRIFLHTV